MGPTSCGSPQLQQSRRHSFDAASRAIGQSALASATPMGQIAEAAAARNGHVSAPTVGNPAKSVATINAANWTIRFIRLL